VIKDNAHCIGEIVEWNGEEHEIIVHAPAFVRLQSPTGVETDISDREFRLLVARGKVRKPDADRLADQRIPDEKAKQEHRYRLSFLAELTKVLKESGGTLSIAEAIPAAHDRVTEDRAYKEYKNGAPSRRSVFNWRKMAKDGGIDALVPETYRRGFAGPHYDYAFEEIVLNLIDESFGKHDRMSVTTLAAKAADEYLKLFGPDQEPGNHGRGSVEAIIDSFYHLDLIKRRLPPDEARARALRARFFNAVHMPLDLVEIDCNTGKILLVDPKNRVVGRPTICAIIDAATGWPLALIPSLTAPKSELVVRALKQSLIPAEKEFFDHYGIENRVGFCGTMKGISSDQGQENGGEGVEAVVGNTSIEWHKCKPKHPQEKPHVERFNREMGRFITTLPGATESVLMPRRTRTELAKTEACLTLEEFDRLLQKWRYDVYGIKPRYRVASPLQSAESPISCWRRLASQAVLPMPPTEKALREMFMVKADTRVLHKYGIEVRGFQFYSEGLDELIDWLGDGSTVEIRYDPHDVREIAVLDPRTKEHFYVPAKDPNILAIGFEEAAKYRRKSEEVKAQERKAGATAYDLALDSDRIMQAKSGKTSKKSSIKKARLEEATRLRHQAILDRSALPPSVNAPMTPAAKVPAMRTPVSRPTTLPTLIDME
jgi:hypothetical protein